jgi:hypothetical protein
MFVRFRQTRRLQVSLIETRRVAGKVRHEHVGGLGAVDVPPTVADRVTFWRGLHERLSRLSNRIDPAMQGKILGEVHARIPMVTIDELRALQLENAEADAEFWESLRDMHQATADDNKGLAAIVERTIANAQAGAKMAGTEAETAKERVARIKRGEDVPGGLSRPPSFEAALRDAGWTTANIKRARAVNAIDELGEFDELLTEIHKRRERSENAALRSVLRRRLRLAKILPSE